MFKETVGLFLITLCLLGFVRSEANISNSDSFLPRSYICQCYCSITDYDISSGVPVVTNLQYAPEVQVILLPESGIQGIKKLNMDKLVRINNKLTEYRIGTLGWHLSSLDLKQFSMVDMPDNDVGAAYPSFNAVFSNVNQFSLDVSKMNGKPKLMFMQSKAEDVGNANLSDEELRNALFPTCLRACGRPAARSQNYAYARMEFFELTTEGRISRQCPLTMPEYYKDIHQSIKDTSKQGVCGPMSLTMQGVKTNWIAVYNELRDLATREYFEKEVVKKYPVLGRPVSTPSIVEMSIDDIRYFESITSESRFSAFMDYLMEKNIELSKVFSYPISSIDGSRVFENKVSPLYEFRAKLVPKDGFWIVADLYVGSEGQYGYARQFLNILIDESDSINLIDNQKRILEGWANEFWTMNGSEGTYIPDDLPSKRSIESARGLSRVEEWLSAKEKQVRSVNADNRVSFLQTGSSKAKMGRFVVTIVISSEVGDPNVEGQSSEVEDQSYQRIEISGAEELHIVYYGHLSVNCFSSANEVGVQPNSMLTFSVYPEKVFLRLNSHSGKEIVIPQVMKRWSVVSTIGGRQSGLFRVLHTTTTPFSKAFRNAYPELWVLLFRDLKYMIGVGSPDAFTLNTCPIPVEGGDIELIFEGEDFAPATTKLFNVNHLGHINSSFASFSNAKSLNTLSMILSSCYHVMAPTSRLRVNSGFDSKDYYCALNEANHHYSLTEY